MQNFVEAPLGQRAILDGVIELLSAPERWHQGSYVNAAGTAWCIRGAIWKVASLDGSLDQDFSEYVAVTNRIDDLCPDGSGSVVPWQNSPGTTHTEVMALLRKARNLA